MRAIVLAVVAACGASPAPASRDARDARTVDITIAHAGATAAELEAQLALPVERAVRRVPGVRTIETRLAAGAATISVELANRAAVDARVGDVRDALAGIRAQLPADAAYPVVQRRPGPPVLVLEVTGPQPPALLADVARDLVRSRLERLAGVAQIDVDGVTTVIAIRPDLARLAALGVTLGDLEAAVRTTGASVPAGRLATADVTLRVEAAVRDLDELGAIVVRSGDGVVTVRDVATVETTARRDAAATAASFPRVTVHAQTGASPREVVAAVRRDVAALAREVPPGVSIVERAVVPPAGGRELWLVGDELEVLDAAATVLAAALARAGVTVVAREPAPATPTHTVEIDRDAAARHGVATSELTRTLRVLAADHEVASLVRDGRTRDVVVRVAGEDLPAMLPQVFVRGGTGALVPLASLVQVRAGLEPSILRRDGRRAIRFVVPADAAGVRAAIDGVRGELPAGVELAFAP